MSKRPANDIPMSPRKGRGAVSNPDGRFEAHSHEAVDDGWDAEEEAGRLVTTLSIDSARTVITRNRSPDVPFEQSINPYRGCEHGCIYCFARPSHEHLGLSAGLDFESRLFYKPDAAEVLRDELAAASYRCKPITLGVNTDAYQPVERRLGLTRRLLETLAEHDHPVSLLTKSALIERDIDILAPMAERQLVEVSFSVTSLDSHLTRELEPRTTAPLKRVEALRRLSAAGIPTGVLVAPVIPVLNDHELEAILETCRQAGAESAGYVVLRLPHGVKDLFREWLEHHAPGKAGHIMSIVRDLHGGKDYDPTFGQRQRGRGVFARLLADRFNAACRRLGLNEKRRELDCGRFAPPSRTGDQLDLFA